MDSSHILKPTVTVSYSVFSKLKRFLGAALLADLVLGNAINVFIEHLNNKGLLGLGPDFRANNMIWGDSIWLNILHILILVFISGLFGLIFGYLSRRVSISEKIIFTTLYVFIRFIFLAIFSIIIESFLPSYASTWSELLSTSIFIISSSPFNATFVILGYVAMYASAFYFIKIGSKIINDPYYMTDKSQNGTLLDIKWYHYLWLFIPISIYSQVLLNLIYKVGHTIVTLIRNFKWSTIFGGSDGDKGNAMDIAWGSLFFITMVAMIVLYLLDYLRKILIGETNQHWAIKVLICLGIALIVPFLIIWFTSLAG